MLRCVDQASLTTLFQENILIGLGQSKDYSNFVTAVIITVVIKKFYNRTKEIDELKRIQGRAFESRSRMTVNDRDVTGRQDFSGGFGGLSADFTNFVSYETLCRFAMGPRGGVGGRIPGSDPAVD